MARILWLLFIGIGLVLPASAQQPKSSVEDTSRALLDNEQVKVKELRLRPRSQIGPATYPNSFVYPLTDGTIVFTHPGKTPFKQKPPVTRGKGKGKARAKAGTKTAAKAAVEAKPKK